MDTHEITSPIPDPDHPGDIPEVHATENRGKYLIPAEGQPDGVVLEVYGMVFATIDEVPHPDDPELQGKLQGFIDGGPDNGCIQGKEDGANLYTFHDADHMAIPVSKINSSKNFLETWATFDDAPDQYVLSMNYVQFRPTNP